jgi:sugar/nucleoside kinase (ribokinase family)
VKYDVVCAGVVYLDMTFAGLSQVPQPGEEHWARDLVLTPGGVANTAVGLARLGLRTAVVSGIGRDLAGQYLRAMLESEQVDCRGPETDRSAVTAVLPIATDRALVSHQPDDVANLDALAGLRTRAVVVLVDQLAELPRLSGTRVYAVTSHAQVHAAAEGTPLRLDGCHAVITNEAEALALTGESDAPSAARALSRSVEAAVVTLGARGALGGSRGQVVHVAAPVVDVRDATGAGDLFAAAYVWADLAGYALDERLNWASLYASLSLGCVTAFAGAGRLAHLLEARARAGLTRPAAATVAQQRAQSTA